MGTTSEKLQKILTTKESIRQAIINKGVNVNSDDAFSLYASKISEIQGSTPNINISTIEELKDNWKFHLVSSTSNASYTSTIEAGKTFDDGSWSTINIPHDWSIYNEFNQGSSAGCTGGFLDGGDAWYRRKINVTDNSKEVLIYFDGVYKNCDVYVNGTKIGDNKWYNPFYFDITQYLNFDGNDVLAVFVRNQQANSRWYSGSGIIRNVYLLTGSKTAFGVDNIKITTDTLKEDLYTGLVSTKVTSNITNNNTSTSVNIKYTVKFNGEVINTLNSIVALSQGNNNIVDTIQIPNPKLWDEYQGNLYDMIIEIISNAEVIYSTTIRYGYRYFEFTHDRGFFLNGRNIKLKGVCMHHDLGCIGASINKSAIQRQVRILKDMGCNAIRLTHNPSSSIYLNVCAEEGIMLVEEAFDCWENGKVTYDFSKEFNSYSESSLKYMVKRGINNPAIIMWSIGNEIPNPTGATAIKLKGYINEIDTSRPVTMGENIPQGSGQQEAMAVMDVIGLNYAKGNTYDSVRNTFPNCKLYGSETTSAISSRGVYARDDVKLQCSSYDDDKVNWGEYAYSALQRHMDTDYLAGMFVWTGFDYIGEPTPFNKYPARSSYFGIIDLAGFPKDIYYMYQSRWTDKPMIHILPHWTHESGNIKVWLYSNCYKVELFLNGTSLGSKLQTQIGSKYQFEYSVTYAAGTLVANGYDKTGAVIAQDVIYTSYGANKLKLTSDKSIVNTNSDDLLFIECDVLDTNNNIVPTADNEITFSCEGGTILGTDNGNATDVTRSLSNNIRKAFNGKALCVVKPDRTSSNVIITATSNGLSTGGISVQQGKITAVSTPVQSFIDATNPPIPEGTEVPVTAINLSQSALNLGTGDNHTLSYTLTPSNTTQTELSWSVSPSGIVSIDNGVINALTSGTCTITCSSVDNPNVSATCSVTVEARAIKITNISLSNNELAIDNGSSVTLTATITPSDATNKTITWSANNSNVTLIPNGLSCTVTGSAIGSSVITAASNDGSNISATCNVTVNAVVVAVTGVSLDKTEASVDVGSSVDLTATISPSNATNTAVSWRADNDKVIVTPNSLYCTVQGVTPGTSTVTVTTDDGSHTAACTITVNDEVIPEGYTRYAKNFDPNGEAFSYTYSNFNANAPATVFVDVVMTTSPLSQNIISFGRKIETWGTGQSQIHTYNMDPHNMGSNDLEINLIYPNGYGHVPPSRKVYATNITNGRVKIAWCGQNFVVNGQKMNIDSAHIDSTFLGKLEADGLQVGSLQGNTRSYSHYNEIGIYDKTMTLEELIALTQI